MLNQPWEEQLRSLVSALHLHAAHDSVETMVKVKDKYKIEWKD